MTKRRRVSLVRSLASSEASVRIANLVKGLAFRAGLDVAALSPHDLSSEQREIYNRVRPFTMTSLGRVLAVIAAAEHVVRRGLEGSFVECGVWRGGSSMAALLAFKRLGDTTREAWLFDTFAGMVGPTASDGEEATAVHSRLIGERDGSHWCRAGLADVRANILSCGYPDDKVRYVVGPVEQTIPASCPERISLLRLDTDWYESTKHELVHLFPRLVDGGILIIDDYGHWQGARRAVDEYFEQHEVRSFLHRIDTTGRLLIKEPTIRRQAASTPLVP